MSDEMDDYEEGEEWAEARQDDLERELVLADVEELSDSAEEQDETPFDETRLAYSGVEEGDGDVDVQELEEAGADSMIRSGRHHRPIGSTDAAPSRSSPNDRMPLGLCHARSAWTWSAWASTHAGSDI